MKVKESKERKEQKKGGLVEEEKSKELTRNTHYFVDEKGIPVSIETANAARSMLRSILGDLDQNDHLTSKNLKGQTCTSWNDMTELAIGHVIAHLELHYPHLKLCEGHWKAKQLAADNFSHYVQSRATKRANIENGEEKPRKRFKKEESTL